MRIPLQYFISVMLLATSAMGSSIDYTTENHWYRRFPDQMESIVAAQERALNQYLGTTLECRLVQFSFNNFESPGVFKKGDYNLNLTATCNKSFKDFSLEVDYYGYSSGEPIILKMSYIYKGELVEEIFDFSDYF